MRGKSDYRCAISAVISGRLPLASHKRTMGNYVDGLGKTHLYRSCGADVYQKLWYDQRIKVLGTVLHGRTLRIISGLRHHPQQLLNISTIKPYT